MWSDWEAFRDIAIEGEKFLGLCDIYVLFPVHFSQRCSECARKDSDWASILGTEPCGYSLTLLSNGADVSHSLSIFFIIAYTKSFRTVVAIYKTYWGHHLKYEIWHRMCRSRVDFRSSCISSASGFLTWVWTTIWCQLVVIVIVAWAKGILFLQLLMRAWNAYTQAAGSELVKNSSALNITKQLSIDGGNCGLSSTTVCFLATASMLFRKRSSCGTRGPCRWGSIAASTLAQGTWELCSVVHFVCNDRTLHTMVMNSELNKME